MNTKGLNAEQIEKYVRMLRMEHREGRADLAPEMHKLLHEQHCRRFNSEKKMITKRIRKSDESEISRRVRFDETSNEVECIQGIMEWKCPTPQNCKCNDIIMYCQHSKRYYY